MIGVSKSLSRQAIDEGYWGGVFGIYWVGVKDIMGMPKRVAVLGVKCFHVSGQNKQKLSKANTSLKQTNFWSRECPL